MKRGRVALIGRPNVGKSTLLNALLGEKVAIISDKPQTTRTTILGVKRSEGGEIIFIDNPGIHRPLHKLNRRMMNFVLSSLETADLLCLLIDATQPYGQGDAFVISLLEKINRPIFLLINKVDIIRKDKILPLIAHYKDLLPFKEIIPISALRGINLDRLEQKIVEYLPEVTGPSYGEEVARLPLRFRIAEIIREKLLRYVEDELPYVTAVYVESIENRATGEKLEKLMAINASIFVERENQVGIVVGRRGQRLKLIGIEARRELEEMLGARVFLDLEVKVEEGWRDRPDVLELIEGQKEETG